MGPPSLPRTLEGPFLPLALQDLPEPPARLYLHGELPDPPRVGIVGTRHPTREAHAYAERLATWLAERGVAILSGGAEGIDAAAHLGALAASGRTCVVAPSSFDRPFPAAHGPLYAEVIARGGGYLSRYEVGVAADRPHFFDRNGILVALCQALVVVEAPLRSGARNAAKWARQLGRPCFVVPSPPWNEQGRGCIRELQLGARALAGPEDVLQLLRPPETAAPSVALVEDSASAVSATLPARPRGPSNAAGSEEDELLGAVLAALEQGARYAEDIASAIAAPLPQVSHALLLLTLRGDVGEGPGGELTRARR